MDNVITNADVDDDRCQLCVSKQHTKQEHRKLWRREYMRDYMYKRGEGKVAYRRKPIVPKTIVDIRDNVGNTKKSIN
jgi:hypothetical protein